MSTSSDQSQSASTGVENTEEGRRLDVAILVEVRFQFEHASIMFPERRAILKRAC
jgi:hypothetical protein